MWLYIRLLQGSESLWKLVHFPGSWQSSSGSPGGAAPRPGGDALRAAPQVLAACPYKKNWHPRLVISDCKIGGRLLIATHLNQSNYPAKQQQVLGFAVPFTSPNIMWKNVGPQPFRWAKPACFCLFFIQFSSAGPHTEHWWSCSYIWWIMSIGIIEVVIDC